MKKLKGGEKLRRKKLNEVDKWFVEGLLSWVEFEVNEIRECLKEGEKLSRSERVFLKKVVEWIDEDKSVGRKFCWVMGRGGFENLRSKLRK